MTRLTISLAALVLALPVAAAAEELLSPEEFREYSEGYTLYFTEQDGEPVGSEAFGPDGQATWQEPDGTCVEGLWHPNEDQLCFYYGFESVVQCWQVLRDAKGLLVRSTNDNQDPPDLTYRIIGRDRKSLLCVGPIGKS